MAQKKIGAKIVIDGEQEFRQALNQSKNAMKEFDSEMKLVSAQFKDNEKSMDALKSKQAVYQKQQQELTKQSKILVDQIQKATVEYNKASEAQDKQADKIKELEKALEGAKDEYGDSADEVKQLEQELSEANAEYAKQERAIANLSGKISKWNTDLNKTETELVETDRALKDTNDAIDHYGDEIDDAEDETRKFGIVMGEAGENTEKLRVSLGNLVTAQVVVDVLRQAAHAIAEVASGAIEVGEKFEASMSKVEALSGASGDQLERLSEKAKEMGSNTVFSASESADAFSYMALAGWDVEQMLDGIEPVLHLAAAANMDLAEASDIVTDYITAFGLSAQDAAHFSDAMAVAMSTSNTTVEDLGEAYKNCAATCGAMGIEMEDATAVLATMANAGVKGSEAGTALNTIMTRLATNTKGCADKLEKYGVQVYDAQGNMNSLSSILGGLSEVWGDLSDKEQAALSKTIAGTSQYSKFQTIMLGVSDAAKEGGQSFEDYAASLRECDGAAESMASTMQDNLQGDITILQSALEGLGIATEGVFDETFRSAVQGATDAIGRLQDNVENGELGVSLAGLSDAFGDLAANIIEGAEEALPGMIDGLTWLIEHLPEIIEFVGVAAGAYLVYEGATLAATVATEGLTVALDTNPIGLLVSAIALACYGLYELADACLDTTNEYTEMAEAAVKGYNDVSDAVSNNASSNQKYVESLDAETELIGDLVKELDGLNSKEELSEAEKKRIADIVAQLNSRYEDLNLQIDEETGKLADNTGKWKENIETQMRIAQVNALQDKLTEAYAKQYDAQMNVYEIQQKLQKIEEEHGSQMEELSRLYDENTAASQANIDRAYELEKALGGVDEEYFALQDSLEQAQQALDEENASIDQMNQYLEENQFQLDETAEAQEALGESTEKTTKLTEDQVKAIDDLSSSVSTSIGNALDLTKQWEQKWETSTDKMTQNIQSQIDGVEKWAENFDKLANNTKVAIDDRVMSYLAEMGTEGAGLVQQLTDELDKSPEKLQEFSDKMAEYLSLQDSASTSIAESYQTTMENVMSGAADAIRENSNYVTEAFDEVQEEVAKAAGNIPDSVRREIEEKSGDVSTAAQNMGKDAVDAIKKELGENGEKVGEIGTASDAALAKALEEGQSIAAAENVSKEVYDAFAKTLTEDAGYTIGKNFIGAMSKAVDEEGAKLLEKAQKIAESVKNTVNNAVPTTPGATPETPGGGAGGGESGGGGGNGGARPVRMTNYTTPSFDNATAAGGMASSQSMVVNNSITVDGAQDPEAWTQTFIRTLKREARMA